MIICALPEMAEWWKAQGAQVEAAFSTPDYTYWKVLDAEDKDPRCKNPDYAGLLIREQFYLAGLTAKKFNTPLYFVRSGGVIANAKNADGLVTVPVSRCRESLGAMFPDKGISIGHCETMTEVRQFLLDSLHTGAGLIMYVLAPALVENFETKNIVRLLDADIVGATPRNEKV